jgi:hypothetical protein
MFVDCPHCHRRVLPMLDGTCPSCDRPVKAAVRASVSAEAISAEAIGDEKFECPACAEWIPADANLCPYCGERFDGRFNGTRGELWRDGDVLVFRKGAELPRRCVKSNEPAEHFLRRKLQWCPPWAYLGLLGGLLPFLVLAIVLTKKAEAEIGLNDEWFHRRRTRILIAWLLCLGGLGLAIAAAVIESGVAAIIGGVTFLVGLIYTAIAVPIVQVKRIDDDYVWLKGIHPDYLADLPYFEDDRRRR